MRNIESTFQADSQNRRQKALNYLFQSRFEDLNQYHQQIITVSQDTQLHRDIEEMVAASNAFIEATSALNEHIISQQRKPRFKGNLRGQRDPDISGLSANGVNLIIISGGQAVVAWHELSPEDFHKIIELCLRGHKEPQAINGPLKNWAAMVEDARKP